MIIKDFQSFNAKRVIDEELSDLVRSCAVAFVKDSKKQWRTVGTKGFYMIYVNEQTAWTLQRNDKNPKIIEIESFQILNQRFKIPFENTILFFDKMREIYENYDKKNSRRFAHEVKEEFKKEILEILPLFQSKKLINPLKTGLLD
jgi:hypothetical protein